MTKPDFPRILTICGSLRTKSLNRDLLDSLVSIGHGRAQFHEYDGLGSLPHFNPDLDQENPPHEIMELRSAVEEAFGIIISSPEYMFSIPGSLKNALDWMASCSVLKGKPVLLLTASSSGARHVHPQLKLVLSTIEANVLESIPMTTMEAQELMKDPQELSLHLEKIISLYRP